MISKTPAPVLPGFRPADFRPAVPDGWKAYVFTRGSDYLLYGHNRGLGLWSNFGSCGKYEVAADRLREEIQWASTGAVKISA